MSEMNWLVHLNRGYPALYITICSHSLFLTLALCGHISHCQCHQKNLAGHLSSTWRTLMHFFLRSSNWAWLVIPWLKMNIKADQSTNDAPTYCTFCKGGKAIWFIKHYHLFPGVLTVNFFSLVLNIEHYREMQKVMEGNYMSLYKVSSLPDIL